MQKTHYIYIIHTREFAEKSEDGNIYKIGKTTKENYIRFKNYPNGSILLYQRICSNCHTIENYIKKEFKKKFVQRRNYGTEYFQGNLQNMIKTVNQILDNEKEIIEECEEKQNKEEEEEEEDEKEEDEKEEDEEELRSIRLIETCEEYLKVSGLDFIITNRRTGKGYVKTSKNQVWYEFCDKNQFIGEEYLKGWIESRLHDSGFFGPNNEFIQNISLWGKLFPNKEYNICDIEYDVDKIHKDILKKKYINKKNLSFYSLKHNEFVILSQNKNHKGYSILDTLSLKFTPLDEFTKGKPLKAENLGYSPSMIIKNEMNTKIIDEILDTLINNNVKNNYKKLLYNLFVKEQKYPIIFEDISYEGILSGWIRDIFHKLTPDDFIYSKDYYENKRILAKKDKCKCVFLNDYFKTIKRQINDFKRLGFKNIIVMNQGKKTNKDLLRYLRNNYENLKNIIKEEYNSANNSTNNELNHIRLYPDTLFLDGSYLITNLLKWIST